MRASIIKVHFTMINCITIIYTSPFDPYVLGFMSTGDDEAPGNYGLLDQTLAFKYLIISLHLNIS